ncbi:hypothetical protein [Larkinella terrae]|uniref:Uncharacterized protein n=1 Tax=Larkinella terrae TaxID=2025311 RepID=A0A7K0ETI4_9BACT|nr:hypothetical protein [Larkinella terrae]MRS64856.1 hypothetical protein [Larkinella terrae]
MKVLSIAAVSLTMVGFLTLALLPTSSFTDDHISRLRFYDANPPTLTIQVCDGFNPVNHEALPVQSRSQLSSIQVVQSPGGLLDSACRNALFLARLYPANEVNLPVSWLLML